MREVRRRAFEVHADIGALPGRCRAGAPYGFDAPSRCSRRGCCTSRQHGNVIFNRHPESAEVEHQVAVGLNIDDSFPVPLYARATPMDIPICVPVPSSRPTMTIGLVEVPNLVHPFFQRVGGEHPVFIFDTCQASWARRDFGHRPLVPLFFDLILPFLPLAVMAFADAFLRSAIVPPAPYCRRCVCCRPRSAPGSTVRCRRARGDPSCDACYNRWPTC